MSKTNKAIRVRALLGKVDSCRFDPDPGLVIFIAEGAMPYAAPWARVPASLRAVLGIALPDELTAEVEQWLSLGKIPIIVSLDGLLEVHVAGVVGEDV